MTLDSIFMPPLAKVEGRRVSPMGAWPALPPHVEAKLRRLERWRRYAQAHKAQRIQAMREYRARKAA
jgi:hypothetical protein